MKKTKEASPRPNNSNPAILEIHKRLIIDWEEFEFERDIVSITKLLINEIIELIKDKTRAIQKNLIPDSVFNG